MTNVRDLTVQEYITAVNYWYKQALKKPACSWSVFREQRKEGRHEKDISKATGPL